MNQRRSFLKSIIAGVALLLGWRPAPESLFDTEKFIRDFDQEIAKPSLDDHADVDECGGFLVPIEFSEAIILTPVLHGEFFQCIPDDGSRRR